jgi:hypothetical protein
VTKNFWVGVLLLGPAACWGAGPAFDVKPGLWEITNTIQMSGMPPIPNLDQMPPEQRARVEAAMKNMAGNPITNTTKSCVTKAGIEDAIAQANSQHGNSCSPKLVSATASRVELDVSCSQAGSDMKSTGKMVIERTDSEHFKGTGSITTTGGHRSMDMKWSSVGKFVSSDCGDVKPK